MFSWKSKRETFVSTQNVSKRNQEHFLCLGHKVLSPQQMLYVLANRETLPTETICGALINLYRLITKLYIFFFLFFFFFFFLGFRMPANQPFLAPLAMRVPKQRITLVSYIFSSYLYSSYSYNLNQYTMKNHVTCPCQSRNCRGKKKRMREMECRHKRSTIVDFRVVLYLLPLFKMSPRAKPFI